MKYLKQLVRSRVFWGRLAITVGLAAVFVLGLTTRRVVYQTQAEAIEGDLPFSLESALHYRRTKILYDRGRLPRVDAGIQHPEGIRIARIDSIASEPFYAKLAGWFPEDVPFQERLRWIEAAWFCLSLPLMMILIRTWTGSWGGGFFAAVLYAVSMGSVLRSTGQEISRENFAIPWLIASQVFAAGYFRAGSSSGRAAWGLGSAALMAMALVGWDMVQYVFAVWTLGALIHVAARGKYSRPEVTGFIGFLLFAVAVVAVAHPYYRHHGLLWSPLMVLMASVVACGIYSRRTTAEMTALKRGAVRIAILLAPVIVVAGISRWTSYGSSYGHFAELLVAKIRHLNVKPDDPGLLTFAQRVMWVPALHSANWALTKWLFPITFWVSCCIAIVAFAKNIRRPDSQFSQWLLLFVFSTAAYVLFVRFHVFVALSSAVICGWAFGRLSPGHPGWRNALAALLVVCSVVEAGHTFEQRAKMGRPNVYYEELKELAEWLEAHIAPDAILGNMGVSAYAAAYGKCAIVIHPKFEDAVIRERFETYASLMFGGDEAALRDWMGDLDVEYLVYGYGEFSSVMPEYQMRYFANRMDPPETAPARRFERDDPTLRYFTKLWGNHKYAVYDVLTEQEESEADELAAQARGMLEQGSLKEAEALAVKALGIDARQQDALDVMRHVGSLLEQGFKQPEPAETTP